MTARSAAPRVLYQDRLGPGQSYHTIAEWDQGSGTQPHPPERVHPGTYTVVTYYQGHRPNGEGTFQDQSMNGHIGVGFDVPGWPGTRTLVAPVVARMSHGASVSRLRWSPEGSHAASDSAWGSNGPSSLSGTP